MALRAPVTSMGAMLKGGYTRWVLLLVAVAGLGTGGRYLFLRLRPDPAREMMTTALPDWQSARFRQGSTAGAQAARDLVAQASRWPEVAAGFERLDRVWPDDEQVRASVNAVNRALAAAGLPYFVDLRHLGERPVAFSYQRLSHAPWRIGARSVDVLRLRRLDTLNVELALTGSTDEGLPVVLMDRIEAMLARELPAMYGHRSERTQLLNGFDRAALARQRSLLEARLGPDLATAAGELAARDKLVDELRSRFARAGLRIHPPEGLVLGDGWLSNLEPYTSYERPGGPVVLESDLRAVARVDGKLASGATAAVLAAAVDLLALSTEAHEARHALDEVDPVGPPPPALFEVMRNSSTKFIGMADRELRAYMGELHDGTAPPCLSLAEMLRGIHGYGAGRTPHFYAAVTILRKLDPDQDSEPALQLAMLCNLPEAELRRRVASAWQELYQAPLPPGERTRT